MVALLQHLVIGLAVVIYGVGAAVLLRGCSSLEEVWGGHFRDRFPISGLEREQTLTLSAFDHAPFFFPVHEVPSSNTILSMGSSSTEAGEVGPQTLATAPSSIRREPELRGENDDANLVGRPLCLN